MPVLSIIACRMLEDELVYLLSADGEVRELLLVDGMQALSLSAKLKAQNRPHLLLSLDRITPHLQERQNRRVGIFSRCRAGRKSEETIIVVSPLPLGLHSDLEQLQAAVYDNIRRLSSLSDGILIFYGKCGGFLANLEHDLPDLACPIYFLTDERGERIEDCIALALGGNENYDRTLAEHQDAALFMTPMWASNWKAMGDEAASGKRRDLRAMLKSSGMKKVAQINTGLCFDPGFEKKVADFAREFGLQRIELPGGTAAAKDSYERARSCLAAARPGCVPPGSQISGSFNSRRLVETIRSICRMTRKKSLEE
jgi:hypothetical protein